MSKFEVLHGGGPGSGPVVGTTSATILPRQDGTHLSATSYCRTYALIQSDIDNTDKVFLLLQNPANPGDPSPGAVLDSGICLNPGDAYEIARGNLYLGEVQAISGSAGQQLYIQLGN